MWTMASRLGCAWRAGLRGSFGCLRGEEEGDSVDHLLQGYDLLGLLVVDLNVELAFELEEDIDAIEGVDAELFEGAIGADGVQRNTPGGCDDTQDAILNALLVSSDDAF